MKRVTGFLVATVAGACVALSQQPPAAQQEMTDAEQRANEAWGRMAVREKLQMLRLHRALREMPVEERGFIHDRIERFLNMSPDDREKLKQNRERWDKMTPEEKEKAREEFRSRRQEIEQRWQREHPGEQPPPGPGFRHGQRPPPPPKSEPQTPKENK